MNVLFFLDNVGPLPDMVPYSQFFSPRSRIAHTSLRFFDASGGGTCARAGFVHLRTAVRARRQADDGAGAVAVPPERIHGGAAQ